MSIRAVSLVWERSRAKGSNRLILLAIADYATDYGLGAFPSNRTLGKKSLLSLRAVQQCLRRLEDDGELTVRYTDSKRYLEICCITDWPSFPKVQAPAKTAGMQSLRGGLTPQSQEGDADFAPEGFPAARAGCSPEATLDPLRDPLFELLQVDEVGDGFVEPVEAVEIPEAERSGPSASPRFLLKAAHTVLNEQPDAGPSDIEARLRTWLAQHHVAYDFAVLGRAVNSAYWQRRHLPAKDSRV